MEYLNSIWNFALPIAGGVTVGGIVLAIASILIKSIVNKAVNRIDQTKISNDASNAAINQVKNIAFSQSIEPIAKSELMKINEMSNKYIQETVADLKKQNAQLFGILQLFASYFDDSIAVSDEKKTALKNALATATTEKITEQQVFIQEQGELPDNSSSNADYEPQTACVER